MSTGPIHDVPGNVGFERHNDGHLQFPASSLRLNRPEIANRDQLRAPVPREASQYESHPQSMDNFSQEPVVPLPINGG